MAASDPHNDQDRERGRRDLLIFLLLLMLGFGCILLTAEIAVRPARIWQASANMLSELNPDRGRRTEELQIQPLRPEVMTPLPWAQLLTPMGTPTVIPLAVVGPPSAGTPTQEVAAVPTPSPSTTPIPYTPTPALTSTPTPTETPTPTTTSTTTPSPSSTPTPTSTPTLPPTNTPPPPPPTNPPPPPTDTPTPPPPIVYSVIPNTSVNTTTVSLKITGLNFEPGCSVQLGTVPLTVTSCLPTVVSATVPTDMVAGYHDLTVTNPDSQLGTLSSAYTATNPIPAVTSMTPALSAISTTNLPVTIAGDYFRNTGTPGGLRASLNGTPLANVAYVSPTELSAEVPFSSPGLGLGGYLLTVVNPGPTDPSGTLLNAFTVYTYTTQVTCDSGVSDCSYAEGEPDGQVAELGAGDVITIDFGAGNGITDGPGYDMVFYEWPNAPGIYLDYTIVEISDDGSTWYTVFAWDGTLGGVAGTNIDGYATDGEEENEPIQSSDLYPGGLTYNTGIAIDIGIWTPPGPSFHLVRFRDPGGVDVAQIDAILRLH